MKKKQGLLVMLLGCLVTVSAVAGVLVWQGAGRKDEENQRHAESEGSSEQLLWNDEETTGTKEETTKAVTETKETVREAREKREAEGHIQDQGTLTILGSIAMF